MSETSGKEARKVAAGRRAKNEVAQPSESHGFPRTKAGANEAVLRLLNAINSAQSQFILQADPNSLFADVLVNLLSLTGSEYGFVGEILQDSPGNPYLKTHAISDIAWNEDIRTLYAEKAPAGMEFHNLETLFGVVIKTGKAVIANDPSNHPSRGGLPEGHPQLTSFVGLPFCHEGKVVGMAGIANRPGGYDEKLIEYVQPLLAACANIMEALWSDQNSKRANEELRDSEERYRALAEAAQDMIYVIGRDGSIEYANGFSAKQFGLQPQQVVGKLRTELFPVDVLKEQEPYVRRVFETGEPAYTERKTPFPGHEVWLGTRLDPIKNERGEVVSVLGISRDITEPKKNEDALARSRDFYLTLFDEFPNPIWRSGTDAKYNYFNKNWLDFTGEALAQEVGDGWMQNIQPEDLARYKEVYFSSFEKRQPFETEYRLRHHTGEYRWVVTFGRPFNDVDGEFAGYIGSCYDVTLRKLQEQQLVYLATHDPLTGLANRLSLEDAMVRVVARTRRGITGALLFLDVDNFKTVNDTLGHAAGDRALIAMGRLLQQQLREGDLLARVGGDEFAVLLEDTSVNDAKNVAERMLSAIKEHIFSLEGHEFNLSFSIGLAVVDGTQTPSEALSEADSAMYRAKDQGGNQVVRSATKSE